MESTGSASPDQRLLAGYRILDLTNERGLFCGKLLADLGAEVIQVERPGGDRARRIGPFFEDSGDPEQSLFWFALNAGKRGITLDLERPEGRGLFKRLVESCDALIESFDPGRLEVLGLGYDRLREWKPDLVMTSIRPFGDDGPYQDYRDADLILWALSGLLFICGDPDRPPVRITLEQAYLHGGADGATGTVMALYHRGRTGEGQRVRVSILQAMERVAYPAHILWDARGKILARPGSALRIPPLGTTTPVIWPCRDGYVAFYLFGGAMGAVSNPALTRWMDEEGLASEGMKTLNWADFNIGTTPQEEIDEKIVGPLRAFFLRHTQEELWEGGVRRRVMVYPVRDAGGIERDPHLRDREFWIQIEHDHLRRTLTYPKPFLHLPPELCRVGGRAPLIGEHNEAVYGGELGLSSADMEALKGGGVI